MPLADVSDYVNRASGGNSGAPEDLAWFKLARVAGGGAGVTIAGRPQSLWLYDGQPSAGVAPTTVAVPTNATAGALKQTDGGGSLDKLLMGTGIWGLNSGVAWLYDRLLHIGSLDGTVTSTQTVGGTLTRYTNGLGNMILLEIYTQIGTTATTIVANYTDQDGNAGVTPAYTFGGTAFREVQRGLLLPLAAGDRGVQGLTNVDLVATTGTAGNFGAAIIHPIASAHLPGAGYGPWKSFNDGHGIPVIPDGACLSVLWFPNSNSAPELYGLSCFVDAA